MTISLRFNDEKRIYQLDYTNISGLFITVFGTIAGVKFVFEILC